MLPSALKWGDADIIEDDCSKQIWQFEVTSWESVELYR